MEPGQSVFTNSGTFTVPKGVRKLQVFCVDGGKGGGMGYLLPDVDMDRWTIQGGSGGNGGKCTVADINVKGVNTINVLVASSEGSATIIGDASLYKNESTSVSYGGSGAKMYVDLIGNAIESFDAGNGQSGIRAFGKSDGTIYAGGGGGGGAYKQDYTGISHGSGGAGGGGSNGNSGGANTGGGGAGGDVTEIVGPYNIYPSYGRRGAGGSGIAIIRWGY